MRMQVELPSLGEDASDEATVAFWLVQEGSTVQEGDDLVELTTDKAAFNVPAPASGTVQEICVHEGDEVTPGTVLCVLDSGD
jgi:pyruvate/2-oxoglutarate dehydrogenase complex dihydrolipoamide acyltransferase (E2) component